MLFADGYGKGIEMKYRKKPIEFCCGAMELTAQKPDNNAKGISRTMALNIKNKSAKARTAYVYRTHANRRNNPEKGIYMVWMNFCPFCGKNIATYEAVE